MIPSYQDIMLPLLNELADRKEHTSRDLYRILADRFGLTEEERTQLMNTGRQPLFNNRVGWAQTYLKKAGLLEAPKRGSYRITKRGLEVLSHTPDSITLDTLMQYPRPPAVGFWSFYCSGVKNMGSVDFIWFRIV